MTDYISLEVALNEANHTLMYDARDHETMIAMIKSIPAADVRPVVRGKWENISDPISCMVGRCSECKEYSVVCSNFCPNCGADMRPERRADNGNV